MDTGTTTPGRIDVIRQIVERNRVGRVLRKHGARNVKLHWNDSSRYTEKETIRAARGGAVMVDELRRLIQS
jgi:alpha-D-ribose 1-methylphosphonate 5-triphosphate synthase subunit PhnG